VRTIGGMGRDWKAATPRGNTLDDKLNIRCRKSTKAYIKRAAKQQNVGTSEFVLDAAVAAAATVNGFKPPTS